MTISGKSMLIKASTEALTFASWRTPVAGFSTASLCEQTNMAYDPDKWIAQLMECHHLPEQDMKILCDTVRAILLEESNIQPVSTPVAICGDIHGQFWDLLELLRKGGNVPETSYIFMARRYACGRWLWRLILSWTLPRGTL